MQITAIGCSLEEIILSCGGLLINSTKIGNAVNLIIADDKGTSNKKYAIQELKEKYGIIINNIDKFDFSLVTQNNVKLIQNILEKNTPETIIIPYNKSRKKNNQILGSSSILAGRQIKNIIMYELKKNSNFTPTLFYDLKNIHKIKNTLLYSLDKSKKSYFKKNIQSFNKNNEKFFLKIKFFEPLQSFRTVLN